MNFARVSLYRGSEPLYNRSRCNYCQLIVDPDTYREIRAILLGSSPLIAYSSEEIPIRDINQLIDVINTAIANGSIPYYWSRTRHVYFPITRAISVTQWKSGYSGKDVEYNLNLEILGAVREVNVNHICSIEDAVNYD